MLHLEFFPTLKMPRKTSQYVVYHKSWCQPYPLLQNVKKNKEECIKLMENVKAWTPSSLPPATLSAFGELTETLHTVYAFMGGQQEGNKIKHFFHQSEMKTMLSDCHTGLQKVFDMFKMEGAINLHGNIAEMQKETERIHKELLEAISNSSDVTVSDKSSSVHIFPTEIGATTHFVIRFTTGPIACTLKFNSMLPAQPKIFHGQEPELRHIVEILHEEPARIAILGADGMGKTSLAKAALHHPDMVSKYQNQFFVASDSASTSIELAALIGLHLGLKPGKELTKPVVNYFSNKGPSLLVFDNLETLWEPMESRGSVEEFLSSLTDVSHLALMANNMPLAMDLIAHLVDHEGCEDILARWETEKISLLSSVHDKRSNLDMSIIISLSSPWLSSGAKDLLSLLSILPDGLSDGHLWHMKMTEKG
ncbi:hypothetical protein C8R44DRAFT_733263 [Mycena epipterygia]|nr:hypothetical protein C8R44DRAFT_733263 [Mycena epipterygia]